MGLKQQLTPTMLMCGKRTGQDVDLPKSTGFSLCQCPFWKAVTACSLMSSPSMYGPQVSKISRNRNGLITFEPGWEHMHACLISVMSCNTTKNENLSDIIHHLSSRDTEILRVEAFPSQFSSVQFSSVYKSWLL